MTPPEPQDASPLIRFLRERTARQWVHFTVICVFMVLSALHQRYDQMSRWFIEDAAISFAYAKHFANGEGLVPFPGGERIEGYSNALWVLLIAIGEYAGIEGFSSAKVLTLILGALCVPMVYFIARHALPQHQDSEAPLIAPLALAVYSQFAIWNASGLENALFNFLLTAAVLRALVEARDGGLPWSALLWFLLTMTRPEGIVYAAIGGFWSMIFQFHAGRGLLPTAKWLGLFWIPWGAYNAWRYNYFAWFFPNTYYAKEKHPDLLNWDHRTWKYVRNWAHNLWAGYALPVVLLGVLGSQRWRGWLALAAAFMVGVVYSYPSNGALEELSFWPDLPAPSWWGTVRVVTALLFAVALPLPAIGGRGWQARVLAWSAGCLAIFFSLYAGADWMKGWRWMSLLSMPYAVLLCVGITELADAVQRLTTRRDAWTTPGWLVASLLAALIVPPNVFHTQQWSKRKETGPFSVKKRVEYMTSVRERLHLEEQPIVWDVDQGAHLYWSDFWMMDMGGLVDVSVAHHNFEKPFMREYMFTELKPHFAHVHGGWATNSKIPTYPEWKREYFEIPGFGAGKKHLHIGNHIRRDIFMKEAWEGTPGREATFEDEVTLRGWEIPSPEVARGRFLYLEVAVHSGRRQPEDNFRVLAFLSQPSGGDTVASWDLPMGYDWLDPAQWRPEETFVGKYDVRLPARLEEGTYDLGFAVFGPDGVLAAQLPEDAEAVEPRFARGEVIFPEAVQIVTVEERTELGRADRQAAVRLAGEGDCEGAAEHWYLSRKHRPANPAYAEQYRSRMNAHLAACWARRAEQEPEAAVDHLEKARIADHRNPTYLAAAKPVADRLYREGLVAMADEDWETAYQKFTDTLRVDRQRAWARRYLEQARDERLGLDDETRKQQKIERQERMRKLREKRKEAQDARAKRAGQLDGLDLKPKKVEVLDKGAEEDAVGGDANGEDEAEP